MNNSKGSSQIFSNVFFVFLALLSFSIGCYLYLPPGRIPGVRGDPDFNMYVLEHGFRWLKGLEKSFWSPAFFYPASNVLAYSDAHIGNLPLYAPLRALGLSREAAYSGWLLLCSALNYASLLIALKLTRWKLSFAPLLGAYFFTFGLPLMAQITHPQLIPRWCIPFAFLFAFKLAEQRKALYFHATIICLILQLYISIYTGYFLAVSLLCTFLAWSLVERKRFEGIMIAKAGKGALAIHFLIVGALLLLLLPLLLPYYEASKTVLNSVLKKEEIASMLPRLQSYFYAPHSILWSAWTTWAEELPMSHEHMLFTGLLPLAAVIYLLMRRPRDESEISPEQPYWRVLLLGLVFIFLGTLSVSGRSLYFVFLSFPGLDALRAVSRIITVMMFPLSVLLAVAGAFLLRGAAHRFGPCSTIPFALILSSFLIVDQAALVPSIPFKEISGPVRQMENEFLQTGKSVVWARRTSPEEPFYVHNLTAMLAAQELGIATINGYSGNIPPRYPWNLFVGDASANDGMKKWADLNGIPLGHIGVTGPERIHTPYALGERIEFVDGGTSDFFTGNGWSPQERTHRWTEGEQADLFFTLYGVDEDSALLLRVKAFPFLAPNEQFRTIRVFANDIHVANWQMTGVQWYQARVSASLLDGGHLEISFEIDKPTAPQDVSGSNDTRKLGMAVTELMFLPDTQ